MPIRRIMRPRTVVDLTDDVVVRQPTVVRPAWSPAQAVALAVGLLFTIMGAIALARTGLSFDQPSAHVGVGGFHHTALLGIVEMIVGLAIVGAGAVPGGGRPSMTFFGVLLFGFGIVVVAEPGAFHGALGTHSGHGALYAVMGAMLLGAAMLSPVFLEQRRSSTTAVVDRERVIR
jgi:hypothetical protein